MILTGKYTHMYTASDHQCFQVFIRSSFPGRITNFEAIYFKKKRSVEK